MTSAVMPTYKSSLISNVNMRSYINNFRRYIGRSLKADLGLKASAFPFDKGAIVKFEFTEDLNEDYIHSPLFNLQEAMHKADLQIEDRNGKMINDFKVSGTHIFLIDNKIFLVKDLTEKEWTEKQAGDDFEGIVSAQ